MLSNSKLILEINEMIEERKGNCAQIILSTFGPYMELPKIDSDVCMRIAAAFGGGINMTGNVCGAITGALMALGLKYGKNIQEMTRVSNQLINEFIAIQGSIICNELVGPDPFNEETASEESLAETFKKCKKCIIDAAHLLEKHSELEKNSQ